jgi:hypothetical protein
VIFETEENRNRCVATFGTTASEVTGKLEINKSNKALKLGEHIMQCQEAFQPSNVIWEN